MRVSVFLLPLSWPHEDAYGFELWHEGQLKGYLGQIHRTKVKVTRSILFSIGISQWYVFLSSEMDLSRKQFGDMAQGLFLAEPKRPFSFPDRINLMGFTKLHTPLTWAVKNVQAYLNCSTFYFIIFQNLK